MKHLFINSLKCLEKNMYYFPHSVSLYMFTTNHRFRGKAKTATFNVFVFPVKCPNAFTPPSSHLIGTI